MFGDWDFEGDRYSHAQDRLLTWFARTQRAVVLEIGAGTAIPSARRFAAALDVPVVRINPVSLRSRANVIFQLRQGRSSH